MEMDMNYTDMLNFNRYIDSVRIRDMIREALADEAIDSYQ
jgi:hypothetical protein